ncbi:hypothetical protein KBZ18_03590 [Synechococcus sp. Cruz-9H2]|uniref:hypothetical protein n=1 Tax=unclassified Synechococcus TaxID=2626047 RepID=UPI0020CFA53E|nr:MULTISPECIES: hypothetical protein [unclassified Synechococcus]MCP9818575.1 hypothetical protein [Synechococcus sp. Cruz-9H2]MCP9855471.1 hypothetical protein [Synechococcus sp. Cruz-9C9]MCP9869554.1 hypothetical protein [Synechococcus sp. Cruz-7B9]
MTRLIRLSFGVVLIVRLLNSKKGGSSALTLLQAMAQVPGRILQLLVSGLSTDSSGSGTGGALAPALGSAGRGNSCGCARNSSSTWGYQPTVAHAGVTGMKG